MEGQKKKVIILAYPLDNQSAGVHVYTREVIHALHENKQRAFEYILIRHEKTTEYPNFQTITIPLLKWIPGYQSFLFFFIYPLVCWWHRASYVVEPAHFGPFNLPKKIKRVTVIHDLTPILFPQFHTFAGWFLHKLFLKRILRNTDLIITNSKHTKKDVAKVYPFTKNKVHYSHLGIADIFEPTIKPSVLTQYELSAPFFLSVGTIEPRKNLIVLLDAFEIFKSKHPKRPMQLVFIGKKGWKSEAFFEKLEQHPYRSAIKIIGFVPTAHLPVFYSMCHAFIYPSIYEGFGLPIAEAIACGARTIVANNSSLVEVGNEETYYFDTPKELIKHIATVAELEQPKQLKRIPKRFSWKKHSLEFEQFLLREQENNNLSSKPEKLA